MLSSIHRRFAKPLFLASAALLLAGAGLLVWKKVHQPWRPKAPENLEPRAAMEALQGPVTYGNSPALSLLERSKPDLLPAKARPPGTEWRASFIQATQDARLFREMDREVRFNEIWLLGEPSSYKPLLDHLIETKDFTLTRIDQTGLIFRRGGEGWSESQLQQSLSSFSDPREHAYAQAMAATRLIAIHQAEPARKLLESAESSAADVPEVWSGWSRYYMAMAKWDRALDAADKSLAIDPDFMPGIACRAQACFATKRFSEAWEAGERLIASGPNDPSILFYHAKLAHQAHAFQAEIASLQKLISLAELARASTSGYRVYLAQAYAAVNDADNAMDQVTLALLDTSLPKEQRQFADELLGQIKQAMK